MKFLTKVIESTLVAPTTRPFKPLNCPFFWIHCVENRSATQNGCQPPASFQAVSGTVRGLQDA